MAAANENRRDEEENNISEAIQKELDTVMDIFEDNQSKILEGDYLRGMNALGALHRHKRTTLDQRRRPGHLLQCWMTLEEIESTDEDLYDEIMEVAERIVVEICGEESSLFSDDNVNLVRRGRERDVFHALMNYKPIEGNAGYETSPMILHHAIHVIMDRLFEDTIYELDIVRPVSCQCGWRGAQGNWDRHISNARHQRWVTTVQENRKIAATSAIEALAASNAALMSPSGGGGGWGGVTGVVGFGIGHTEDTEDTEDME